MNAQCVECGIVTPVFGARQVMAIHGSNGLCRGSQSDAATRQRGPATPCYVCSRPQSWGMGHPCNYCEAHGWQAYDPLHTPPTTPAFSATTAGDWLTTAA